MGRKKIAITRLTDERNRQVIALCPGYIHLKLAVCVLQTLEVDVTTVIVT